MLVKNLRRPAQHGQTAGHISFRVLNKRGEVAQVVKVPAGESVEVPGLKVDDKRIKPLLDGRWIQVKE